MLLTGKIRLVPKKRPPADSPEKSNVPDTAYLHERMRSLGLSWNELGKPFDLKPVVVERIFRGGRPPRIAEIVAWAKMLDVPFVPLVRRFGYEVPDFTVPVIGALRANGRISEYVLDSPTSQHERIGAPADASPLSVAIVVESSDPIWDGGYFYYEPAKVLRTDAIGKLAVIGIADRAAQIVGVLDRARAGIAYRIRPFGGRDTIESEQVGSATPITWQRIGLGRL